MTTNSSYAGLDASLSSLNSIDNDTSTTSNANIDTQQSKWASSNTSFSASPLASRDSSPTRPSAKQGRMSRSTTDVPTSSPSRKNSLQQNPSPTRSKSSLPTASTIPRQGLASAPVLAPPSVSETPIRAPIPLKPSLAADNSKDTPRWPVSPRLKSPPPMLNNRPAASQARKTESDGPSTNLQRPVPSALADAPAQTGSADDDLEDLSVQSGTKTPVRGSTNMLETVQEVSQPNTPRPGLDFMAEKATERHAESAVAATRKHSKSTQSSQQNSESGSDSGSVKTSTRRSSSAAPAPLLHKRRSSTALKFSGQRGQTESSSRNMTVETEQVSNMQKLSLTPATAAQGNVGSLRPKPSTETIKPRKEKKKPTRKPTSVAAGTASSKADVFEAKVASAVEEANSSDSDETFVYDSNPPEAGERPRPYHHSRTPSATSMASQVNGNVPRSLHSALEPGPTTNPPARKSMKFVNTFHGSGTESPVPDEDGRGTGRSNAGSGRGTARHHHHIGRWGRNHGNNHTSLFDNESPFPNAARPKLAASNPPSPRTVTGGRGWMSNGKRHLHVSSAYDLDDTGARADDEQTPLISNGTVRSGRPRGGRRNVRNLEAQTYRQRPTFLNRFASCLVLTVMLLLVITGAIGFMFATSQPLTDIELVKIGNVLASEQELMMDIQVRAHNPNVVVVMVDSANIELFAKSPYAGTDSEWWRHPDGPEDGDMFSMDDPAEDPPPDESAPNMRLGNVLELDSPLTYEGSFFRSGVSTSTGSLRLARPGNTTDGGSERWERILADDFTLLLKGVLRYTLPLSQRVRSVPISGKAMVKPNSSNDPSLEPNRTMIGIN